MWDDPVLLTVNELSINKSQLLTIVIQKVAIILQVHVKLFILEATTIATTTSSDQILGGLTRVNTDIM